MVAAAGAGVAAVEHELLGRQPRFVGRLVEVGGLVDEFLPAVGRVDVDFDHARIGRHAQCRQARITRRLVAFEDQWQAHLDGGVLDGRDEFEVVLEHRHRRHEHIEPTIARFGAQGGAGDPSRGLEGLRSARLRQRHRCAGLARALRGARSLGKARCARASSGMRPGPARCARGIGCAGTTTAFIGAEGKAQAPVRRQRRERLGLVGRVHPGHVALRRPGLGVERQAKAHRRIAGHEVATFGTQEPRAGLPAGQAVRVASDRQHVPDHLVEPLAEDLAQALAFERVGQTRIEGVDVGRQLAFTPEVVPGVLVGGKDVLGIERQTARHAREETARLALGDLAVLALVGKQLRVRPDRFAVLAPVEVERPAGQLLARVPLALTVVQQPAVAVLQAQLLHQVGGQQTLGRAHGLGVPLGAIAVIDRHEGRLTALRESNVIAAQVVIDPVTERLDALPLRIGVGQRDPWRFPDAGDAHVVFELGLALVDGAAHRGGRRRVGRTRERDVAFAGEQPRGRVEPDPAGAGQEDLAPCVQVGEIDLGAARAVERLHIALELDQVARHEPRREPEVTKHLHQQPAGVAAGARSLDQRFFRRLHTGLETDEVADVLLQTLVELDQEVVGVPARAGHRLDVLREQRRELAANEVRSKLAGELGLVGERKVFGRGLEEEIERVEHRHLGHQIDLDAKRRGLVGEDQPGEVVGLRVLLPVDEVGRRLHPHRIAQDAGARMRRWTQPDDLRTEVNRPVVPVVGHVVERDMDGHSGLQEPQDQGLTVMR